MKHFSFPFGKLLGWATLAVLSTITGCGTSSPEDLSPVVTPVAPADPIVPVRNFSYTTHDALIPVIDGPNDDHAAEIDIRLYLPQNATPETPQPAILVTHGFGNTKLAAEVTSLGDFFARNGYIVLTHSSQGFGGSSGCIRLNSFDYDVKNVMQLIDNVLEDPAFVVDGINVAPLVATDATGARVGMMGGSYGGGITPNVAVSDPRVRAIVPGRTWNSLQYALVPNNLIVDNTASGFDHQVTEQGVFKQGWTTLLFALGNAQPAMNNGGCPEEKAASGDPATIGGASCTGFPSELCETFIRLVGTGNAEQVDLDLVRNSSVASRIDDLTVPTMLQQGLTDTLFNTNDATATYLKLKENGVPVAMMWHFPGHGAYNPTPGECETYGGQINPVPDGCYLTDRALAWFERWLREDSSIDTGPEFTWFREHIPYDESGSAESRYGVADEFPVYPPTRFFLSGSADLVTDATAITDGSANMLNPAGGAPASFTEQSNFQSPEATPSFDALPPSDPTGQFVAFTSAPFARDTEAVGIPTAHLNLSNVNPAQDVVFFGKLFDVAPDGSAELIRRRIAPVRVPIADVGSPIDIRLTGMSHLFRAGHSVRLVLATTDQTSFNQRLPDSITVTTGGDDPSYLDLPID